MDQSSTPRILGDFQIIREMGRGGMGVVYEARQRSLSRQVALKVLSSGLGLTEKAVTRFRREAEAAAKLHHTNIVPIYATGEDRDVHYYAMELIDGPSLDHVIRQMRDARSATAVEDPAQASSDSGRSDGLPQWVSETLAYEKPSSARGGPTSDPAPTDGTESAGSIPSGSRYFDTVATMMAGVADALDHAHNQGVIHRDIKPSNLLLSPDGRLSVNDFGLARMLEQPGMTISGEFVGSPLYMSPEQITAGRAPLDHRTDIYSLGATLYELLTLEPPSPGTTRDQVIAQIMHKEITPSRRKNRKVPVDLDTICMKALERDPDRRYQTAGELAADLRRFVDRHAIQARRVGIVGRTAKWARRHPALTVSYSIMLLLLVLLVSTGYIVWQHELDRSKEKTIDMAMRGRFDEARIQLETVRRLRGSKGWIHMLQGQIAMQEGHYEEAGQSLREAQRLMPNSTAAYSLLTIVHLLSGNEDQYIRNLPALEKRKPIDFYDRLFKGYAEAWFLSKRALDNLNAAVEERPDNQVARALRARALLNNGMMEPSATTGRRYVREGLDDLSPVLRYWKDTPWLLADYVYTNMGLMYLSRELGQPNEEQLYLRQAQDGVNRLLDLPDLHVASDVVIDFLGLTNQEKRLRQETRRQLDRSDRLSGYTGVFAAIHLYRMGDSKLALEAFGRTPRQLRSSTEWTSAFIQMDSPDADPQVLLAEFLRELEARKTEHSGILLHLDWPVLRMLGMPKDDATAIGVVNAMESSFRRYFLEDEGYGDKLAEFMRGECNDAELLEAAADNRGRMTGANFIIGVDCLAEGDRVSAKRYFQAAVDTSFFFYYVYRWSLAFLKRVDDPDWLPWLPPKDDRN